MWPPCTCRAQKENTHFGSSSFSLFRTVGLGPGAQGSPAANPAWRFVLPRSSWRLSCWVTAVRPSLLTVGSPAGQATPRSSGGTRVPLEERGVPLEERGVPGGRRAGRRAVRGRAGGARVGDEYIIQDYADLTPPARGRRKRAHGGPHDVATPWLPPLRKRVALEKGASGDGNLVLPARRGVCDSQLRRGCVSELHL